jgi:hypothetical protein
MRTCHYCGRDWPHPLLYDVRRDNTADPVGRCAACSFFGRKQLRLPLEAA